MTAPVIKAAGVAFLAGREGTALPQRLVLFLQRGGEGDFSGYWCLPGGGVEDDESRQQAAKREVREETGHRVKGELFELSRTRRAHEAAGEPSTAVPAVDGTVGAAPPLSPAVPLPPEVDYTTFAQKLDETFDVELNEEHTAHTWAPVSSPPQPLHPGVAIALSRLTMNELDIARAMAAGDLVGPVSHHNMVMFAMRITGTGVAYRRGLREYVFRDPAKYLNPDFLARCNGLNVIVEHPKGSTLDSREFADRIVGNIFLPYIRGDEVWGIAKIYDEPTVRLLRENQLSTSPAVVFRDPKHTNTKLTLEDGSVVLREGDPDLLDHVAICPKGVWDKGGEPRGIEFETREDADMTEEEERLAAAEKAKKDAEEKAAKEKADAEEKAKKDAEEEARKKADADAGVMLDKVLACVDSITKRMDAYDEEAKKRADAEAEEKRKAGDPEQVAADKAKKDAEEKEKAKKDAEEKEKADRARADADQSIRDSVKALADSIPKVLTDAELNELADNQSRADSVFSAFGLDAPRPIPGEPPLQYRRRVLGTLKVHSPRWKDTDLENIADDDNGRKMFANIEEAVYADAQAAGEHPADVPEGTLREIVRPDSTGRRVVIFKGQPRDWMNGFSAPKRRLNGIRNRA